MAQLVFIQIYSDNHRIIPKHPGNLIIWILRFLLGLLIQMNNDKNIIFLGQFRT